MKDSRDISAAQTHLTRSLSALSSRGRRPDKSNEERVETEASQPLV